jgi:hypothetical protein
MKYIGYKLVLGGTSSGVRLASNGELYLAASATVFERRSDAQVVAMHASWRHLPGRHCGPLRVIGLVRPPATYPAFLREWRKA